MTAVLRFQKRNFSDNITSKGTEKGINNGSLIALKKHNERQELCQSMEVKSKRATNIDTSLSHHNIYYEKMKYSDIQEIKDTPHRANTSGVFELVFDFQDLTEEESSNFDPQKHKELIEEYLKEIGISENFKRLSFVYHKDEKNPHYHLIYSGINKQSNTFDINNYFNPKIKGEAQRDENNNLIYQVENRGKRKGLPKLDSDGNKIIKYDYTRRNGTQYLQDTWSDHLTKSKNTNYSNKKQFISILGFSDSIFHRFSEQTKQRVYLIRETDTERNKALLDGNYDTAKELEEFMRSEIEKVLDIAQDIQMEIAVERKNSQKLKILTPNQ